MDGGRWLESGYNSPRYTYFSRHVRQNILHKGEDDLAVNDPVIDLDFLGRDWPGIACQVIDARGNDDDFRFQRDHIRP